MMKTPCWVGCTIDYLSFATVGLCRVGKLFADAGMICLVSFISPYRKDREAARKLHTAAGLPFIECHVHVPLSVAVRTTPCVGVLARF